MKLTSADIYIVRIDGRHPVVVELRTDAGVTGLGEAAIAYGVGETAAAGMIKDLLEVVPHARAHPAAAFSGSLPLARRGRGASKRRASA